MKIRNLTIALILLMAGVAGATQTQRFWDGSTDAKWSVATNWSGDTLPLIGDTCLFNAGAAACSLDITDTVQALIMTTGYTGAWNQAGNTLYTNGIDSINTGGAITLNRKLVVLGDANFSFNSAGTATVTTCTLDVQGTGSFTITKTNTLFKSLYMAAAGKTTTIVNIGSASGCNNDVHIGAGTLTISTSKVLYIITTNTSPLVFAAGYTISGAGTIQLNPGSTATYSIPKLITAGAFGVISNGNFTTTINFDTLSVGGAVSLGTQHASPVFTYNFNGDSVYIGGAFTWGNISTGRSILNTGNAGVVIVGAVDGTTRTGGTTALNLGSSTVDVWSNWKLSAEDTIGGGTSTLLLNNAGAATFKDANATNLYYNVTKQGAGVLTDSSGIKCTGTLTHTAGTHTGIAGTYLQAGSFISDGATVTSPDSLVVTGATGQAHFGSTGTFTGFTKGIHMSTANGTIDGDIAFTPNKLQINSGAVVTNSGAAQTNYTSTSQTPITFVNGGQLTVNRSLIFYKSTAGAFMNIIAGTPVINGSAYISLWMTGSGRYTIPGFTYTGTNEFDIQNSASLADTISFTGPVSVKTTYITNANNSTFVLNTNGNRFTSTDLYIGNAGAGSVFVSNFTDSVFATTVSGGYSTGSLTHNISGVWTINGDITFQASAVYNNAGSRAVFTGTTGSVATSGKRMFEDYTIQSSGTRAFTGSTKVDSFLQTSGGISIANHSGYDTFNHANITGGSVLFQGDSVYFEDLNIAGTTITPDASTLWKLNGSGSSSINNAGATRMVFADACVVGKLTVVDGTVQFQGSPTSTAGGFIFNSASPDSTIGPTDGAFNCTGASDTFHIGSTAIPAMTGDSLKMTTATAGVIDQDVVNTMKNLTVNGTITNAGATYTVYKSTTTPIRILTGSTLTNNSEIVGDVTASCYGISLTGTPTINGTGLFQFRYIGDNIFDTFPAITFGGGLNVILRGGAPNDTGTFDLVGRFVVADTLELKTTGINDGVKTTVRANGYTISAGSLNYGNPRLASSGIFVFDDSVLVAGAVNATAYNTGACDITKSGVWTVGTGYTALSLSTYTSTGSKGTFAGTGSYTSNGKKPFEDITVASSGTVTFADAWKCDTFLHTGGAVAVAAHAGADSVLKHFSSTGGTWGATDTLVFGVNVANIITGAASTISTGAGTLWKALKDNVTLALNGKSWPKFQATGGINVEDGGTIPYIDMLTTASDSIKIEAGKKLVCTSCDTAGLNGPTGQYITFLSSVAGTQDTVTLPAGLVMSRTKWKDTHSTNTLYINNGTNENLGNLK